MRAPLLDSLHLWLEATLAVVSRKSETAEAIRYALGRWRALLRYCDDGRIEIDNNAAERALRAVALGRKNYLVRRIRCRRRTGRRHLQPDRHGQAQRHRPGSISCATC